MTFISVHIGAGNHSVKKEERYISLLEEACLKGNKLLALGKSAEEAVTKAVSILENSKDTNAGFGSHLNIEGQVECDASVSRTKDFRYGSVGCLQGVKNPVVAAHRLLLYQEEESKREKCATLGLVPPCFLVGKACQDWCLKQGIESNEDLVSDSAKRHHVRYMSKLNGITNQVEPPPPKIQRLADDCDEDSGVTDTVGAVALDSTGNVAACCSSGGIALKERGRIGPAAVFGAGLWTGTSSKGRIKVGVSASGQGEQLLATTISRSVGQKLVSKKDSLLPVKEGIQRLFYGAPELSATEPHLRMIGLMALEHETATGKSTFHYGHTTPSFGVAWMSSSQSKPVSKISRKNPFSKEAVVCELHDVV